MRNAEVIRAELELARDEINAAYWAFTRQARAKPPFLVVPDAYRRKAALERELEACLRAGVSADG